MLKVFYICLFLFLLTACSVVFAQTQQQQKKNIKAFSELYGRVRFFHPSDESAKVNWFLFSLYGVHKMRGVKNDRELIEELKSLILPIAPSVLIDSVPIHNKLIINKISPNNLINYKLVSWVHHGLALYEESTVYKSQRLNRDIIEISYIDYPLSTMLIDQSSGGNFDFTVEIICDSTDRKKDKLFAASFEGSNRLKNKSTIDYVTKKYIKYRFQGYLPKGTSYINFTLRLPKQRIVKINHPTIYIMNGSNAKAYSFKEPFDEHKAAANITLAIAEDKKFYKTGTTSVSDIISLKLGEKLYASVPTSLYATPTATFPQVDSLVFDAFKKKLKDFWSNKPPEYSKDARFANMINTLLVLKFAFPYWKDTKTNPDQLFSFLFSKTIKDKTDLDFLETLRLMSAKLNDGHMGIYYNGPERVQEKSIELVSEMIDNKIYVKQVLTPSLKSLASGSIIDSIDGVSALKIFQSKFRLISGSPQWRTYKSLLALFDGIGDTVKVVLNDSGTRKTYRLARTILDQEYRPVALPGYIPNDGLIADNIYYFNLTGDSVMSKINASLTALKDAKSIMFDMRGYPKEDLRPVLRHLLEDSEHSRWMHIPKIAYGTIGKRFESSGWDLGANAPFFKGKIIFLSDACAQSQSESILGYVKGLKLGTIVGKPTSGTNGQVHTISLLDEFAVYFTGMKVTNADGSKSHLKGIIPDIPVYSTPAGLKAGKDEVFDKALEFAHL
ncbi:hypothetical protein ACVWYN_002925 [Pedobacter sp. UYP24]